MSVAIAVNAIITVAEVKDYLKIGVAAADTSQDDFFQTWINNISGDMESMNGINNKIVSQGVVSEIRDGNGRDKLRPNYFPIIAIGPLTPARTDIAQTTTTITREAGSFLLDGWAVGDGGTIADSGSNNGAAFTITTAAALTLTVSQTLTAQTTAQTVSCVLTPNTATKLASIQVRDDVDSAWADISDDIDQILLNNPNLFHLSEQASYNFELTEEEFTEGTANISLTYRAGWSSVPSGLSIVCLEKVVEVYKNSGRGGDRFGISSFSKSEGGGTKNTSYKDLTERHNRIMAPYKRRV